MNKHIEEAMRLFDKAGHSDVSFVDSYCLASIASSLIAIAMMMEEQNKPIISEAKSSDYGAMSVPCNKKDNL